MCEDGELRMAKEENTTEVIEKELQVYFERRRKSAVEKAKRK